MMKTEQGDPKKRMLSEGLLKKLEEIRGGLDWVSEGTSAGEILQHYRERVKFNPDNSALLSEKEVAILEAISHAEGGAAEEFSSEELSNEELQTRFGKICEGLDWVPSSHASAAEVLEKYNAMLKINPDNAQLLSERELEMIEELDRRERNAK